MNYIIFGKNGKDSMKAIVKSLNREDVTLLKRAKNGIIRTYNIEKDLFIKQKLEINDIIKNGDTVIRYGCPLKINLDIKEINKSSGILLASNKFLARKELKQKNIPIPDTSNSFEYAKINYVSKGKPVIVRPVQHKRGEYFYVCDNERDLALACAKILAQTGFTYYISEVFPKTREFRAHCAHGKVLALLEKPKPENPDQIAWNLAVNGMQWTLLKWVDYKKDLCKIAVDAINALGLDFGAVDILSYPNVEGFPKHVVCEVNTAPTLSPYEIERYSKYFNLLINKDIKHFDPVWQVGKSFAWKNFQFKAD